MAISLSKNQSIDLSKSAPGLSRLHMGLGWDPVKKSGFLGRLLGGRGDSIDLDASCLLFDSQKQLVEAVWFNQLKSRDGAIVHSGDNLTGEGEGDDEIIRANLTKLPASVHFLVLTVNSFRGQTFDEVENAFCRLVDEANGKEICRYELNEKGQHTGVIMAVISRNGASWSVKAIGNPASGQTANDMAKAAASLI